MQLSFFCSSTGRYTKSEADIVDQFYHSVTTYAILIWVTMIG